MKFCWGLSALALALVATHAHAQSSSPPSSSSSSSGLDETRRIEAREHFTRGVDLIHSARWLDAIAELEAARAIRSTPAVLYNLGLAQRAVGRNHAAVESFRAFVQATDASRVDLINQANNYIAELAPAVAMITLDVIPPNASVQLDGQAVTERRVEVDPGRHVVTAQAAGLESETRAFDVARGGSAVVELHLVGAAVAARLHVDTNVSNAFIRVDGHPVGFGTADENLMPGHHVLEVTAPRRSSFRREFDAIAGGRTNVRAELSDQRTIFENPIFWGAVGVGVAAALVLGFTIFSNTQAPISGSLGLVPNAVIVWR